VTVFYGQAGRRKPPARRGSGTSVATAVQVHAKNYTCYKKNLFIKKKLQ